MGNPETQTEEAEITRTLQAVIGVESLDRVQQIGLRYDVEVRTLKTEGQPYDTDDMESDGEDVIETIVPKGKVLVSITSKGSSPFWQELLRPAPEV